MIRNIKGNNLLRKYQEGATITTPKVSPKAISFTSGFETDRGYPNNGYTSSTEPRNMSDDYGYILEDLPEPLQVILLDAVHNQSNLPGTILLSLAENNPELYNTFIQDNAPGGMQSITPMKYAILIGNSIGSVKAYEAKDTPSSYWINAIKPMLLEAYNNDPSKFIDDFTKSRIQRNSSFGNNSKMEEWSERSVAAAEYAKDLIEGDAQLPAYYYNADENENVFKEQIKPIIDYINTEGIKFPGDSDPNVKAWYDKISNILDVDVKNIQNKQRVLTEPDNILKDEDVPVTTTRDVQEVIEEPVAEEPTTEEPVGVTPEPKEPVKTSVTKNVIADTPYTSIDNNFGKDEQDVYTDGWSEKHYIFDNNTKWEVDRAGNKIKDTDKILTSGEKEEFINSSWKLDKTIDESIDQESIEQPNVLKTVGNVLNKSVEKIDNSLRDKNPYRDESYGPIKDKNKELRDKNKAERQKNQAVRKTKIENIKQDNILKKINEKKDKREIINARREKAERKSEDKLEAAKGSGDEKTEKAIVGIKSRDEIQTKKREDKVRFRKRKAELNLLNEEIKQLEKQQKQHWKRKKREEKNVTGKKGYEKTQQDLEDYKNFLEDDARYKFVPPKRYGGKLRAFKKGGNLIKYQGNNSVISGGTSDSAGNYNSAYGTERPIVPGQTIFIGGTPESRYRNSIDRLPQAERDAIKQAEKDKMRDFTLFVGSGREAARKNDIAKRKWLKDYQTGGNLPKHQVDSTIGYTPEFWKQYITPVTPESKIVYPGIGKWLGTEQYYNRFGDPVSPDETPPPPTITPPYLPGVTPDKTTKPFSAWDKPEYTDYDPYSLMRPSHKMSDAANWGVTGYNLALASQAPEKTPIFMTDYTPKRQYAPVDFTQAIKQQRIGRRGIAENTRDTAGLMGNLQQLNANILDRKVAIAKSAADKQLGFDKVYETAKEGRAKELKDQRINQYYKNLEHEATKQNALTETISKWNKQQQAKAKYIQAENSDMNTIKGYVNELSPDYKVVVDKDGMVSVVYNNTNKEAREETKKLNAERRKGITVNINELKAQRKKLSPETDKDKISEIDTLIKNLIQNLSEIKDPNSSRAIPYKIKPTNPLLEDGTNPGNKKGGNIKSRKTTNILMDGGYTPKTKRQKKLRTKLY